MARFVGRGAPGRADFGGTGAQARLVGKLAKPLAPGKSIMIKLNKPVGCSYYLLGKFSDESESDNDGIDLCKEKSLRLTE